MEKLRRLIILAVLMMLAIATAACNGQEEGGSSGTGGGSGGSVYEPNRQQGEIWQWALGKSLDDPALRQYTVGIKRDSAYVQSEGFALHFDSAMTVYSVSLFNDERSLGLGSENTFSAYQGELPGGLSWRMTTTDVLNKVGKPDDSYTTGYGVELSFTYRNLDGYAVEIDLAARHQQDLWDSPMHVIKVSVA